MAYPEAIERIRSLTDLNDIQQTHQQLSEELGVLWSSLASLADKELAMFLIEPIETPMDGNSAILKSRVNDILNCWK